MADNRTTSLQYHAGWNAPLRLLAMLAVLPCGCASSELPVFEARNPPVVWPASPKKTRIAYVGELATSDDLKPRRGALSGLSEAVFGRKDAHGVLTPFALCTDDADRLFVADTGAQVVHVFDLKTRRYEQWKPSGKTRFTQPVGVAWDPAGRLIVSDSAGGRLFVFDSSGNFQGELAASLLQRPAGIAIDRSSRRIFVADVGAHQVLVLSPEGELVTRIGHRGDGLGEFNYPTHLAIDSKGYIFVSDSLNFRIQMFSPAFKAVRTIGQAGDLPGYLSHPKGIAFDSEDHLYIVDARQEIVQIFDQENHLLLFFGGEGHGPGQFWLPSGIHIDARNRIWIADTYNKRVSVFDYLPEKQP
jgi:DNA-binding beta-propeller fold protein YncE